MKPQVHEDRAISTEAHYTMAFAAEQFAYHFARKAYAARKSSQSKNISYDACAEAVRKSPALSFLSELVPPRMTFAESRAAAAASLEAAHGGEMDVDGDEGGDDDEVPWHAIFHLIDPTVPPTWILSRRFLPVV